MASNGSVTHDRREETPEAKARWFQSLSLAERMEMLCSFTDLALAARPDLQERKHAEPIAGRIQVLCLSELSESEDADQGDSGG